MDFRKDREMQKMEEEKEEEEEEGGGGGGGGGGRGGGGGKVGRGGGKVMSKSVNLNLCIFCLLDVNAITSESFFVDKAC